MFRTHKGNITLRLFDTDEAALKAGRIGNSRVDGLRMFNGGWMYLRDGEFFDTSGRIPAGVFSPELPIEEWVEYSRDLAVYLHGAQKYGDQPYKVHLVDVFNVLLRFGLNTPALLGATWLHDTREDLRLTREYLLFRSVPAAIDELVDRVTDEPGANRAERKKKTLPKTAGSVDGVSLKLADRIANVERGGSEKMYAAEHAEFRAALFTNEPAHAPMWKHLDRLLGFGAN